MIPVEIFVVDKDVLVGVERFSEVEGDECVFWFG